MSGYRIKDIDGYEGRYAVTDDGRVWSYGRNMWLSPWKHKKGYKHVDLGRKVFKVHRLVAAAFIENANAYPQVNHIDGNKANNAASNLEWCDNSHNVKHAWDNGLMYVSDKLHDWNRSRRRFIPAEILTIRAMKRSGNFTNSQIAKCFKVSAGTIRQIVNGETYKEVQA